VKTGIRLIVALAAASMVVLVAGPAVATGPNEPDPPACTTDCPIDNSTPVTGQVGSCHAAAGPSYIGLACAGSKDHAGKTVKQILGHDPVPTCWFEPMNADDLASMNLQNKPGPDGWTWYWRRCLHGITKKSPSMANATYDIGPRKVPNGTHVKTLTTRQKHLVKGRGTNSQVPTPIAAVSPSDHPRVRQPVAFYDGTGDTVTAQAADVLLTAHIDHIVIHPLGAGSTERPVNCPGTGQPADFGDTPQSRPSLCWYTYQHSSADQPDEAYPAEISAYWVVESQVAGGASQVFARFTKSEITTIPVTDVQTLVVS